MSDKDWAETLFNMAEGSPSEYDALRYKDVFEFFHILTAHQVRMAKLKPKKK